MPEEGFFICSWKKTKKGFEIWVVEKPEWRVIAATIGAAEDELIDLIMDEGGPTHPVWEYDHPTPKATRDLEFTNPDLVIISGCDRAQLAFDDRQSSQDYSELGEDDFYLGSICGNCRSPSGARSELPLPIGRAPANHDGYFVSCHTFLQVYSERFLSLLTRTERSKLELLETSRDKRIRKKFFELVGPNGMPTVGVKGRKPDGWQCKDCGYRYWGYFKDTSDISNYVALDDLPDPLPSVFTVGASPYVRLGMTAKRWSQLVGKPGAKGIHSMQLGVVGAKRLLRKPRLTIRDNTPEEVIDIETLPEYQEGVEAADAAARAVPPMIRPITKSKFEAELFTGDYVVVWGSSPCQLKVDEKLAATFSDRLEQSAHFLRGEVCGNCLRTTAQRNEIPLPISNIPDDQDAILQSDIGLLSGASHLFSDEFLSLLTPKERRSLDFRPAVRVDGGTPTFYELVGPPGLEYVKVNGLEAWGGSPCTHCKRFRWSYIIGLSDLLSFVSADDLPPPTTSVFTIGYQPFVELCMTYKRWKKMAGKPGTRGLQAFQLGVAPPHRVDRTVKNWRSTV